MTSSTLLLTLQVGTRTTHYGPRISIVVGSRKRGVLHRLFSGHNFNNDLSVGIRRLFGFQRRVTIFVHYTRRRRVIITHKTSSTIKFIGRNVKTLSGMATTIVLL